MESSKRATSGGGPGASHEDANECLYQFGPYLFLARRQLLTRAGTRIRVGRRALDVLKLLLDHAGEFVSKDALITHAWGDRDAVSDTSFRVTLSELRRVFQDDPTYAHCIVTARQRGYQFNAPVSSFQRPFYLPSGDTAAPTLPEPPPLFGREDDVQAVLTALARHRLVSVVGAGGIGKTSTVMAALRRLAEAGDREIRVVELAATTDPRFVATAIARALNIVVHSEDDAAALVAALRRRRMLLVLDSCEHVLDACAALLERLIVALPDLVCLVTSREPLRIRGELVLRLQALALPGPEQALEADAALRFPAIAFFLDRATAAGGTLALNTTTIAQVAALCRQLEGLPLAIELVAPRVSAFGMMELEALLQDRLQLLRLETRGTVERHTSLYATLDWSYELLCAEAQRVLRWMSIFPAAFSLSDLRALLDDLPPGALLNAVEHLVATSMVVVKMQASATTYRLLDTTRAYAGWRLTGRGERAEAARRHALLQLELLMSADEKAEVVPTWACERIVEDVRAALRWALEDGDARLGVMLTVAAIPLWLRFSLLSECQMHIQTLLDADAARPHITPMRRMKLMAALGAAMLYTKGPSADVEPILTTALTLADELDHPPHRLRARWALAVYMVFVGRLREALRHLRGYRQLATRLGDPEDRASAARLLATVQHYSGRQITAERRLEQLWTSQRTSNHPSMLSRFQFDQRVATTVTLSKVLWLRGRQWDAIDMADSAIEEANASGHPVSLCNALGHAAIPIALLCGDLGEARRHLRALEDHLSHHDLPIWRHLANGLAAMVLLREGDAIGITGLQDAHHHLEQAGFLLRRSQYQVALAEGLAMAGRVSEAITTLEAARAWCLTSGERWYLPEVLRLLAELRESPNGPEPQPHTLHRQAIALATAQGAVVWDLRASTSLATRLLDEGRLQEAQALIESALARTGPARSGADGQAARLVLERARLASSVMSSAARGT